MEGYGFVSSVNTLCLCRESFRPQAVALNVSSSHLLFNLLNTRKGTFSLQAKGSLPDSVKGSHRLFPSAVSQHTEVHTVQDDESEISMFTMQEWFNEKPAGFGVGKVYDTSIEDKIMEDMQHDKDTNFINALKQVKNGNTMKNPKSDTKENQRGKSPEIPFGVQVWIGKLPKKRNVERDLWAAFKDVPGLLGIQPFVLANEKTRDPICKGSGFLTFSDVVLANKFIRQFEGRSLMFGKVEKLPVYKLSQNLDTVSLGSSLGSTEENSTLSRLRANHKRVDTSRENYDAFHMEGLVVQEVETTSASEVSNEHDTFKEHEFPLDLATHGNQQGLCVIASDIEDNSIKIATMEKHVTVTDEGPIQYSKYNQTSDELDCIEPERSDLEELKIWSNKSGASDHNKERRAFYSKNNTKDETQESASASTIIGQISLPEIDENILYKDDIDARIKNLESIVEELQLQLGLSHLPQPSTGDSERFENFSNFQPRAFDGIVDQVKLCEGNAGSYTGNTAEVRIRQLEVTLQDLQLQLQSSLLPKAQAKTLSSEGERHELGEAKLKALENRIQKKFRSCKNVNSKLNSKQRIGTKSKQKLGSANRLKKKEKKIILDVISKYGK